MVRTFLSLLAGAVALAAAGATTLPATAAAAAATGAPLRRRRSPRASIAGHTVPYFDFGPIKLLPGNKIAPIWAVTNGAAGQHNVIDTVPGQATDSPALAGEHGHAGPLSTLSAR